MVQFPTLICAQQRGLTRRRYDEYQDCSLCQEAQISRSDHHDTGCRKSPRSFADYGLDFLDTCLPKTRSRSPWRHGPTKGRVMTPEQGQVFSVQAFSLQAFSTPFIRFLPSGQLSGSNIGQNTIALRVSGAPLPCLISHDKMTKKNFVKGGMLTEKESSAQ